MSIWRLSKREREVEALMLEGLSHKQIADRIGLSRNTVKTHIRAVYSKRGVSSNVEVLAWHMQQPFPPPGMMYSKDGQRLELCEYTFDTSGVPNAILVLADWDCDSPWQAPTWNVPLPELKLEYIALGSYRSVR